MSENKEKYQQQILFDEVNISSKKENLPSLTEQVVISSEHFTEDASIEKVDEPVNMKKRPRWLWRVVFALFVTLLGIEVVDFFIAGFTQSPITASIYGLLLVILSFISGSYLYKELKGLRQFKRRKHIQKQFHEAQLSTNNKDLQQLFTEVTAQLPCDFSFEQENELFNTEKIELNNSEQIQLYSKRILSTVDQKALDKVCKYSTESVVLVALSPIAIVDMLLMLWRNLKMLNEIAQLYGMKLSYWSRIKLIKQVFVNMIYAGASELIADVGTELLSADLLGKLSARLAQGLGAGMLTARLGLKTMQLCRPIPFEEDAPKLKDVRKQLINQIKTLSSKSE